MLRNKEEGSKEIKRGFGKEGREKAKDWKSSRYDMHMYQTPNLNIIIMYGKLLIKHFLKIKLGL